MRIAAVSAALMLGIGVILGSAGTALASSNTCTWTGAVDSNFETAGNWTGCGVAAPGVADNVVLGADAAFADGTEQLPKGFSINDLNLNGHNLTVGPHAAISLGGHLTGAGNIGVDGYLMLSPADSANSWSGNLSIGMAGSVLANLINDSASTAASTILGAAANHVTIAAGGVLMFTSANGATIPQPLTVGGSGDTTTVSPSGAIISAATGGCGGATCNPALAEATADANITFSGAVSLTADTQVASDGLMTITTAPTGGYALTLAPDQVGTLSIPGVVKASTAATTLADNLPEAGVTAATGDTVVVDGTRGAVNITGGTLKGTGTVGVVTMTDGHIAPGHSPGVLHTGNLVWSGGSYQAELGGTAAGQFDQLVVTGTVSLGSAVTGLDLSLYGDIKPAVGDKFIIIDNDSDDAVSGTFKGLAEGGTVTVNGTEYQITYKGGTGNDVVVTVTKAAAVAATATDPAGEVLGAADEAGVPNTGSALITINPLLVLLVMLGSSAGLLLIWRRMNRSLQL